MILVKFRRVARSILFAIYKCTVKLSLTSRVILESKDFQNPLKSLLVLQLEDKQSHSKGQLIPLTTTLIMLGFSENIYLNK